MTEKALRYLTGFGNEHASEALKGALPAGQNAPQKPPRGLYTEQISGTPFTTLRGQNRRSWLYRIRPSAMHPAFRRIERDAIIPRCPTGVPPLSCRGESDAPREGPVVRILFPPAESPSLSRSCCRGSRTPAFRAAVRRWLGDRAGRDAQGVSRRANRRQYLCRAIFQYRRAADGGRREC